MSKRALEALQEELESAATDLKHRLFLLASIIEEKRKEQFTIKESQLQDASPEPELGKSTQPDLSEELGEVQPGPTPAAVDSPEIQTEEISPASWAIREHWENKEKQDQARTTQPGAAQARDSYFHQPEHDQKARARDVHSSPILGSAIKGLLYFALLGPGLTFFVLMMGLFSTTPFPIWGYWNS